jgi:hypothetical protein
MPSNILLVRRQLPDSLHAAALLHIGRDAIFIENTALRFDLVKKGNIHAFQPTVCSNSENIISRCKKTRGAIVGKRL